MSKDNDLVPDHFFASLPFWNELERAEQHGVKLETKEFLKARIGVDISRFKMAEALFNLQKLLEGKGLFVKYVESDALRFSYRTAYRYIEVYKKAVNRLSAATLRRAAAKGMELIGYQAERPFGDYTESIKLLPPPSDESKVDDWLDELEEKRKSLPRRAKRTVAPEASLKIAFASVYRRFKGLPTGKTRVAWSQRLIGLLMAEMGLPAQRFEPEAVPEGFRPKVGRPKKPTK